MAICSRCREQPGEHRVGHERGDAQEDERETERKDREHADFVGDADVRRVIGAAVGAASAVGHQQAVEFGDDGVRWPRAPA
jgi:hypothetical protein